MKKLFAVRAHSVKGDFGLFLLRIVAGLAFMFHGWPKIRNPFGWMGPDADMPGFLQALAAVAEFGGGLAWILGLLMPLASFGIACTMAVATHLHAIRLGDPFVNPSGGSYELAAVYLAMAIMFLLMGPGRYSADRKLFGGGRR
ncbi:MAG: DoxX family protein [Acidobacteriota bacterium]